LFFTGCGLKGNPVPPFAPPVIDYSKIIVNLQAVALSDAIRLKWIFQDKDKLVDYIAVEKSEIGTNGNVCKDCPLQFTRIDTIPTEEMPLSVGYVDKEVSKNKIYVYRLMLCKKSGACMDSLAKTKI